MQRCILLYGLVVSMACSIRAATLTIPGTSNAWLASRPQGGDGDPPPFFSFFQPGDQLQFSVSGEAGYAPGVETGPDGNQQYPLDHSAENELAGIQGAPANALVGVFLDDRDPATVGLPPATLDFSTPAKRDFTRLSPAVRQPFLIGDGTTAEGVRQTVQVPDGATRLYFGMMDGSGWYNNTGEFAVTITGGTLQQLAPVTAFSYRTVAPIRSNNPFEFTALEPAVASDLRLRVQFSRTPSVESSWSDLPSGSQMFRVDDTWTARLTDLPEGEIYLRAIASAPGYQDQISTLLGPIEVLPGIAPFGALSYETTSPLRTGAPWAFRIAEPTQIPGLRLRVQAAADPDLESSWSDLPGAEMTRDGAFWYVEMPSVPGGHFTFRVIASAPDYLDRVSAALGSFSIGPALNVVKRQFNESGQRTLASLQDNPDSPEMILAEAIGEANVRFALGDLAGGNQILAVAMVVYSQRLASVQVLVDTGESLTTPALNIGPGGSLVLKGEINGDLGALGVRSVLLISNDGGSLISNDGASVISHDGASQQSVAAASLSSSATQNLISQDGASIISNDGASVISTDGASFAPQAWHATGTGSLALQGRASRAGTAAASAATGLMRVHGNYRQEQGAALTIAISGTNAAPGQMEYDRLVVEGRAELSGVIAFGFLQPPNIPGPGAAFAPAVGASFDVVIATNIITQGLIVRGPVWGDGLHFRWSVVSIGDGQEALRLTAARIPPVLAIRRSGPGLQIAWPTNFTGFTLQSAIGFVGPWGAIAQGGHTATVSPTNSSGFFFLSKDTP